MNDRDYRAEYEARAARARAQGFASYGEQRRAAKAVAAETRRRALETVGLMRRKNLSLSVASKRSLTTPAEVRRVAAPALTQEGRRWVPTKSDRLSRRMVLLTTAGVVEVTVRSSGKASQIGNYWTAVRRYLSTGDASDLSEFTGRSVSGATFVTDLDVIEAWARTGELDLDDIYSLVSN